ncbi:MAG: molecular chaperone DnaJ [Ramlibacter sp.]
MERALDVDECYRELGIQPGSSDAQVKAAWRRLAARWHPDRNDSPDAVRKIQRINNALEAIRKARQGGGDEPVPQQDAVELSVDIALEELASGCTRELRGEVVESCARCQGSGLESQPTSCSECGGSGSLRQSLWVAWLSPPVECGACSGLGKTRQGCRGCEATGKVPGRSYSCQVQISPTVRSGSVLEVSAPVHGRLDPVSLRVRIRLTSHEFFRVERDGTVTCEIPVDGFAWVASCWVHVPTPIGLQQMRLRRGTLHYRIKGAGLPWQNSDARADCIITVAPLFPDDLSRQQQAIIDHLVASNTGAPGTAAGHRMAAWDCQLANWRARVESLRQ